MHKESIESIEVEFGGLRPQQAPAELRGRVLADVHRELTAARWERRLGRATAALVAVGLALNLSLGFEPSGKPHGMQVAGGLSQQSLVDAGVTVAEATDARTGQQLARHLANLAGVPLTPQLGAAIDLAIERRFLADHDNNPEKEG